MDSMYVGRIILGRVDTYKKLASIEFNIIQPTEAYSNSAIA